MKCSVRFTIVMALLALQPQERYGLRCYENLHASLPLLSKQFSEEANPSECDGSCFVAGLSLTGFEVTLRICMPLDVRMPDACIGTDIIPGKKKIGFPIKVCFCNLDLCNTNVTEIKERPDHSSNKKPSMLPYLKNGEARAEFQKNGAKRPDNSNKKRNLLPSLNKRDIRDELRKYVIGGPDHSHQNPPSSNNGYANGGYPFHNRNKMSQSSNNGYASGGSQKNGGGRPDSGSNHQPPSNNGDSGFQKKGGEWPDSTNKNSGSQKNGARQSDINNRVYALLALMSVSFYITFV